MLNISLKKSKKPLTVIAAMIAAVSLTCAFAYSKTSFAKNTATCGEIGEYSLSAQSEAEEKAFLEQFGIAVSGAAETESVIIPSRFNGVYNDYNRLQNEIGLDLEPYRGTQAQKHTYKMNGGGYAVLLVSGGRVIGGHRTPREYGEEELPLG